MLRGGDWQESLRIRAVPAVAYHGFATDAALSVAAAAARRASTGTAGCGNDDMYVGRSEGLVVVAATAHSHVADEIRRAAA